MVNHKFGRNAARCAAAAAGLWIAAAANTASAETRTYVVSWFTQGMYSTDGDCGPKGINPPMEEQWVIDLVTSLGMSEEEAKKVVERSASRNDPGKDEAYAMIVNRGRVDGKPVNAYNNPQTVKDPNMRAVVGTKGFGFNLDGNAATGFEDPETGEKGVDNQMFRALGCIKNLRANPPLRSSDTEQWWHLIQDYQPAWLISITADDFTNSANATIVFDRALEHASWDANSNTRRDMTYRVDSDPRSHTELKGSIKNKVFHASTDQELTMVGDLLVMPYLSLKKANVRIKILDDGGLDGFVGGFQDWKEVLFPIGAGGNAFEMNVQHDIPGIYYLLKKNADAYPDPKTGENTHISAAWRIEAVPSFNIPANKPGKVQADAGSSKAAR
jgi:hypothetical protein